MNDHEFDQMLRDQHEAFMSEIAATSSGPQPVNIAVTQRTPLPTPIRRRPNWTLLTRGVTTLAASALLAMTVNGDRPEIPDAPAMMDGGGTEAEGGSITVTWAAPGGKHAGDEVISYTITADGLPSRTVMTTQTVFTGLKNGETYRFTVTANLRSGSLDLPFVARSGAPILTIVDISVIDSTRIEVELAVNYEDGRPVTCLIFVNGWKNRMAGCSADRVFFEVHGLLPDTRNVILVKAVADNGTVVDLIETTVWTPGW